MSRRRTQQEPWVAPSDVERARSLSEQLAAVRARKPADPCPCCHSLSHADDCPLWAGAGR